MDVHAQKADFFSAFTANWKVPELPAEEHGQTIYFWPGFKAQQPEMGLPVLQLVMQYGQGASRKWQLQSWFVHAPQAVTADAIPLHDRNPRPVSCSTLGSGKTTRTGTDNNQIEW